jgi:outer membrane protein assembly factor BamB
VNKLRQFAGPFGLIVAALLLSSCGIFDEKDDEELQPKELLKLQDKLRVKKLWTAKVGGDFEFLLMGLRPVGDGNRIYAAGSDGDVIAVNPQSGKQHWKSELDTGLSAGPAVNTGIVAVGTKDGFVVVLDANSGAEQWRVDVGGEILAKPLIDDTNVYVQTIDNRLIALARFDGKQRWEMEQTPPVLTMRGASSPMMIGSSVIAGFDNGRLIAINIDTGDIEWDAMLSLPTGRSDLDRLSDIDGSIAVVGQDVYAAGYQGRIASIASESGQVLWSREISSMVGVAADWNSIYTTRNDGEVIALTRTNGADYWRNDDLLRREPTLPIPFQSVVVVGDFEGYLHFFSSIDGTAVARVRLGNKAISSTPVVVANRLYVQSDDGVVAAYETIQDRPKRPAPDAAEPADDES